MLLGNEPHRAGEASGGLRISRLIAGPHHDANFPNVRGERLLDQDAENGFFDSVMD